MKHDELLPGRRNWTRAEDYLPARSRRSAPADRAPATALPTSPTGPREPERSLLGLVPFVLLMLGLGVLALAIAVAAWPGRQLVPAQGRSAAAPAVETVVELQDEARR